MPAHVERLLRRWRLRLNPRATAQIASSRNLTLVCQRGRRRVFLKAASGPNDPGIDFESRVLTTLAKRFAGSTEAPLVPSVYASAPGLLAVDWLEGATLFTRRRTGRSGEDAALGAAIAWVHARTAEVPERDVVSDFGTRLVWTTPHIYAGLSVGGLELFATVQADHRATKQLLWLFERERAAPKHFVHGDLRQANVLVSRGRVALLDWELSGFGDPARDLGMLLADDFAAYLVSRSRQEKQTAQQFRAHARAILRAYGRTAKTLGLRLGARWPERVIGWLAEAMLRRAYTVAHHEGHFGASERYVVAVSLELLRRSARWARSYFGAAA